MTMRGLLLRNLTLEVPILDEYQVVARVIDVGRRDIYVVKRARPQGETGPPQVLLVSLATLPVVLIVRAQLSSPRILTCYFSVSATLSSKVPKC